MQALDRLAGVYATFEDTRANVDNEISAGDVLVAEAFEAMDELASAQQHQGRFHDERKSSHESLDICSTGRRRGRVKTERLLGSS